MRKVLDQFWFGWICGGLVVLILCVILFPHDNGKTKQYPGTLVVKEVTEQYALAETATGFAWLIDPEDWDKGDLVSAIFDDNGTPDDIRDDAIVQARFSGVQVMTE